jgi:hypothetical protein
MKLSEPVIEDILSAMRQNIAENQEITRKTLLECARLEEKIKLLERENNRLIGMKIIGWVIMIVIDVVFWILMIWGIIIVADRMKM